MESIILEKKIKLENSYNNKIKIKKKKKINTKEKED